jgi:hypothetical protein
MADARQVVDGECAWYGEVKSRLGGGECWGGGNGQAGYLYGLTERASTLVLSQQARAIERRQARGKLWPGNGNRCAWRRGD